MVWQQVHFDKIKKRGSSKRNNVHQNVKENVDQKIFNINSRLVIILPRW